MKLAEIITIFTFVFLVNITTGNGAPQWRPQGRFGKRLDQRFPSSWQLGNDNSNIDVYPVLDEPNVSVETDSTDQSSFNIKDKLCVESNIPGLYRCYRKKRSAFQSRTPDEP